MTDPHHSQPRKTTGSPLTDAKGAVILLHGRGATAESMLQFANELPQQDITFIALQAANQTWYPYSFLEPQERNEPELSSAIRAIDSVLSDITDTGIPTNNILLVGFSQGACLTSEYIATHPQRYGGVAVLSGGLIGDNLNEDVYSGDLDSTPIFLGCSDVDPHIPVERVHFTARVFRSLNGDVTKRIYEGMGHGINADEVRYVSGMIERLQGTNS